MSQTTTSISSGVRVRRHPEIGMVDIEVDLDGLLEWAAYSEAVRTSAIREVERLIPLGVNMGYIQRKIPKGITPFTVSRLDAAPHAIGVCIAATPAGLRYARDRWGEIVGLLDQTASDPSGAAIQPPLVDGPYHPA
ncbi:hypothetical protein ACWKWV_00485 [Castellaniella ginsengisoli]